MYSIEVEFYFLNRFWATLLGTRGNLHTPSIARWKACGRLPVRHSWTFSLSLTVETLQAEICQSRRFSKGWVTLSANFKRKGRRPPTTVGVRKLKWLPYCVVSKYPQVLSQCTRVTDGRTELRQLIPRKHSCCSGGKSYENWYKLRQYSDPRYFGRSHFEINPERYASYPDWRISPQCRSPSSASLSHGSRLSDALLTFSLFDFVGEPQGQRLQK